MTTKSQLEEQLRKISTYFPKCEKTSVRNATEMVVSRAIEMKGVFSERSVTLAAAREHFSRMERNATELAKALRNPDFRVFTEMDVRNFATGLNDEEVRKILRTEKETAKKKGKPFLARGIEFALDPITTTADRFAEMLDGLAGIAERRARLASGGKGEVRLAEQYGYPKPKQIVAIFVILLYELSAGKKPDPTNPAALDACQAIWECIASREGASDQSIDAASQTGWVDPLKNARAAMKDAAEWSESKHKLDSMSASEKWEDRQWAANNPLIQPSRGVITAWNAVQIVTFILDRAGVKVVDSSKN